MSFAKRQADMWGDTGDRPPPTYKQCIGELMRTGYCPPFVVLLVAKIDIEQLPPPNDDVEAFRLYLTDGEYVMQGASGFLTPLLLRLS